LVTFPKYVLTIEWHNFRNYIPTRRYKIAAARPVTNISQLAKARCYATERLVM